MTSLTGTTPSTTRDGWNLVLFEIIATAGLVALISARARPRRRYRFRGRRLHRRCVLVHCINLVRQPAVIIGRMFSDTFPASRRILPATTIAEHEIQLCEQANATVRPPVVFVHGLWLLPSSGVADHFEEVIRGLDKKPAIIGHSFGGLLTQILAGWGLAAASVAIDPAPFRGCFRCRSRR